MAAKKRRDAMLVQDFVPEPDAFYLGIKSLNINTVAAAKDEKASIIPVAAKHLCREIPAEVCQSRGRIDPSRSALNYSLLPGLMSEAAITARAITVMEEHGIEWRQMRKDKIMGVELVFSLPPGFKDDSRIFFTECLQWVERHFPQPAQIIAAVVHLDEAAPHLHIVLVPIVEHGRMDGHQVVGYKGVYTKRVNSFHDEVAQRFGLRKPRSKVKLTHAERHDLADRIIAQMMSDGWVASPQSVKEMRRVLITDPLQMAQSMGLSANDSATLESRPTAYAVDDSVVPSQATALLCNAVHGNASINDEQIGSANTVETTLTAPAVPSRIIPSMRPHTKEWVKIMTRATVPERPPWKPRQAPPSSPPIIIPSKQEPIGPAASEPIRRSQPPTQTSARSQVMLGLRAASHMRGRAW